MGESAYDRTAFDFFRRGAGLRLGDDAGEIFDFTVFTFDMLASRVTCGAGCPESVLIAVLRRYDAVCGHEDRTVEGFELFLLLPPCISIVSGEVLVLLKERIVVRREHLGVGIDIHTASFSLVEKHFQIFQVVSGNQNSRVLPHTDVYGSDFRIAVSCGICLIEKSHAFHACFTGLKGQLYQVVYGKAVIQCCGKRLLNESVYIGIIL